MTRTPSVAIEQTSPLRGKSRNGTAVHGREHITSAPAALAEREKELTALHAAVRLLAGGETSLALMLRALVELLPPAFQFPDIADACISFGEIDARTAGFGESSWTLRESFATEAGTTGCIKVAYREQPPRTAAGPFLAEERALLKTLAKMIGAAFEHRAAAAALRASEEQFRRIAEALDEVFWLYDWESGEHIYLNSAFETVWGSQVRSGREIARVFLDSILAEDRAAVDAFLEQQKQQLICEVRYRIRRPDGTIRWIHDRAFPIRDSEGRPYRTAGVAKDITATADSEQQFTSGVARISSLTPRQRQVLQLLAEGKSVKEAAFLLGRSPKTIETHKAELMQRLKIPDIAALVRFAMRQGLIR